MQRRLRQSLIVPPLHLLCADQLALELESSIMLPDTSASDTQSVLETVAQLPMDLIRIIFNSVHLSKRSLKFLLDTSDTASPLREVITERFIETKNNDQKYASDVYYEDDYSFDGLEESLQAKREVNLMFHSSKSAINASDACQRLVEDVVANQTTDPLFPNSKHNDWRSKPGLIQYIKTTKDRKLDRKIDSTLERGCSTVSLIFTGDGSNTLFHNMQQAVHTEQCKRMPFLSSRSLIQCRINILRALLLSAQQLVQRIYQDIAALSETIHVTMDATRIWLQKYSSNAEHNDAEQFWQALVAVRELLVIHSSKSMIQNQPQKYISENALAQQLKIIGRLLPRTYLLTKAVASMCPLAHTFILLVDSAEAILSSAEYEVTSMMRAVQQYFPEHDMQEYNAYSDVRLVRISDSRLFDYRNQIRRSLLSNERTSAVTYCFNAARMDDETYFERACNELKTLLSTFSLRSNRRRRHNDLLWEDGGSSFDERVVHIVFTRFDVLQSRIRENSLDLSDVFRNSIEEGTALSTENLQELFTLLFNEILGSHTQFFYHFVDSTNEASYEMYWRSLRNATLCKALKPVIYLYAPNDIQQKREPVNEEFPVSVSLTLPQRDYFLSVYPMDDSNFDSHDSDWRLTDSKTLNRRFHQWNIQSVDSMGNIRMKSTTEPEDSELPQRRSRVVPYLFWESIASSWQLRNWQFRTESQLGPVHCVARGIVPQYLEHCLELIGLNDRETNDFIVFWLPKMTKHSSVLVQWIVYSEDKRSNVIGDENAQQFFERSLAAMKIQPEPQSLLRVYIIIKGIDGSQANPPIDIQTEADLHNESKFLHSSFTIGHQRSEGFAVVEWGGSDLS